MSELHRWAKAVATRTSTADPKFQATLRAWIESEHELLVLFRYAYAAGSREFQFFQDYTSLAEHISRLPAKTSVIALRRPQLSIRGVVDSDFIERCIASIPSEAEYLIVETERRVYGSRAWFHDAAGDGHSSLREDLEECRGAPVAVGVHPSWLVDNDYVISAIVADVDGEVRPGAY